jgi:small subunit ribosomal protein S5
MYMAKPRKKMKREKPEFEQKLLDLRRVTRVVKGGRRFRFRATVVIGDRRGKVGVGVAKGSDVSDAISKAFMSAKKTMIEVSLVDGTIIHDVEVKLGSAKILLKPAKEGRGLIAGGAVRTVVELAGVQDITSKSLGTSNKLNVARATLRALSLVSLHSKINQAKKPTVTKKKEALSEKKEGVKEISEKKAKKKAGMKKGVKATAPKKEKVISKK